MPPELVDGTRHIPDRETFELLARRDDVPGAVEVREVKVLVAGADGAAPVLHLLNTRAWAFHYCFARNVLAVGLSNGEFNRVTYFTDQRRFIAASVLAHDGFVAADGSAGIYTLEFWPSDPVHAHSVALTYRLLAAAMPFAQGRLAYHAASETQRGLVEEEGEELAAAGVRLVSTEELFGDRAYNPLNLGEGFGVLRVVDGSDPRPPSVRDVVILPLLPNDLTHVAGVMSEEPQTPLSHVNLKAKQNDTPNAFVRDASHHPRVEPLLGKLVHYRVEADDFELRKASAEEAEEFLQRMRPAQPQVPPRDLGRTEIVPLAEVGLDDVAAFGGKSAGLGELLRLLPAGLVPAGFAVPFSFYDAFMEDNGFYEDVAEMLADPDFQADPEARDEALSKLRKALRKGEMGRAARDALEAVQRSFPQDQPLRCRSSANNEDLAGFNGAGLYDSFTHRPDEGHLEKSVQQVWASLWNYRAFEERDFWRIDHLRAAMGVAIHPNFDDERANGVAVTRNLIDPRFEGYYVNVQVGEALVTNPEPGAVPEELLLAFLTPGDPRPEVQYIRRSSLIPRDERVLTRQEIDLLVVQMRAIQGHFARLYGREGDPTFAMDIEFKITAGDALAIKQARPWVD